MSSARAFTFILLTLAVAIFIAICGGVSGKYWAGLPVFAWCSIVAFAIQWLVFIPAWFSHSEKFFDLTGSLSFIALVIMALVTTGDPDPRAYLLGGMVLVWATRLGTFLFTRVRTAGSDSRFDEMKYRLPSFLLTWTLQGLWVLMTGASAIAAITSHNPTTLDGFAAVGLIIWAGGLTLEITADEQKRRFRKSLENRGRFIRSGLWSLCRHPNYLGEITLWLGVSVVALPALSGWALVTLISPIFVWILLTKISGVPMLESAADHKWGGDPEYEAYKASTPRLLPEISKRAN